VLLVDEADSLLIDEARTPLVISQAGTDRDGAEESCFRWCSELAPTFVEAVDFERLPQAGSVVLTAAGRNRLLAARPPASAARLTLNELMQALERAILINLRYVRDRDYVIRDGKLLIVDEFTGRTSDGRTWSAGIHQALEAREGLALTPQARTSAQITVQDFVCRFRTLAGMTGTARESASEFRSVYGLTVAKVAPHRVSQRIALDPVILGTASEKWSAVADEVARIRSAGAAVLVGTRTIEASEALAAVLSERGQPHVVLSARVPENEAEIVAEAGQPGRVTVATNMAGRGTDIRIADSVRAAGGLHVIGTELHASSRIDRQLTGRCARQGDPGAHRWFLSAEDEILTSAHGKRDPVRRALSPRDFRRAQRIVERRHARDRLLLRLTTAALARQYEVLGLDPILHSIE
jgi:preprotein translocase subunit SecA